MSTEDMFPSIWEKEGEGEGEREKRREWGDWVPPILALCEMTLLQLTQPHRPERFLTKLLIIMVIKDDSIDFSTNGATKTG